MKLLKLSFSIVSTQGFHKALSGMMTFASLYFAIKNSLGKTLDNLHFAIANPKRAKAPYRPMVSAKHLTLRHRLFLLFFGIT